MPAAVELPFFRNRAETQSVRLACWSCGQAYAPAAGPAPTCCQHCAAPRASGLTVGASSAL